VERPGLRYQRRGINADGAAANFVETEMIASIKRGESEQLASFVQTRGSSAFCCVARPCDSYKLVPLFWHQNPYSLKPIPVLDRTPEYNRTALRRHFDRQKELYGPQVIVNLAEHSGKEAVVTDAYKGGVGALGDEQLKWVYARLSTYADLL
jgi:hypothetical protein